MTDISGFFSYLTYFWSCIPSDLVSMLAGVFGVTMVIAIIRLLY